MSVESQTTFKELFYDNPAAAVSLLETNPFLKPRARVFVQTEFGFKLEQFKRDNRWMSELLRRYLPSTEPEKIISLGCGWGLELIFLRDQYPNTPLVGIDNTDDHTSIQTVLVTSLFTNGQFLHADLNRVNPTTLLPRKRGPAYVVSRQPGPISSKNEKQFWLPVLNTWAQTTIKRTRGMLLVTCILEEEVSAIESSLRKNGLDPHLDTFEEGRVLVGSHRMDHYVLTVSS